MKKRYLVIKNDKGNEKEYASLRKNSAFLLNEGKLLICALFFQGKEVSSQSKCIGLHLLCGSLY